MNLRKHFKNIVLSITTTVCCLMSNSGFGQSNSFIDVEKDFPKQEKNLRKWDAPVIADLDQDGYPDLLINDHGYGVQVCWNNKGKFEKPFDIIIGDIHGVSVGDFDKDGILELIVSRGGGSGSNARNSKIFKVNKQREFTDFPDFKKPLALMRGRTVKFLDADNDGDLDLLNFAFPDKDRNGESENYIYKNNGQGELILHATLPAIKADGQKILVTDFNGDQVFDLIMYGGGHVKAYQGKEHMTYEDVTDKIFPYKIDKTTSVVQIDYDNDGDLDLFFTRSQEFEIGETFYDGDSETWGFFTKRGAFKFDDLEIGDVLDIENFQSQWPNNDTFFIGESAYDYEFPGETHSGKNIRLVNSNALGFPDDYSEKTGTYIGYVGNNNWRISGSLWAPATGVVHGVKDYPKYEHPKAPHDILLENKGGRFVDVTKKANMFFEDFTESATVADFDNNGFQDILMVRRGDLIHKNKSVIYLNQGDASFELLKEHGVITTELGAIGMAVGTVDYDLDGKVDVVIGNERGKWHLFRNNLKSTDKNNFTTVVVGNSKKGNASPLGALVTIKSCNNTQSYTIGDTGAAYSSNYNTFVHFGVGSCDKPVKVKITWTNGETEETTIKSLNTKVFIGTNN
ncbi:CRTAC1 family protein [Tamlana agarivorans]|uniref:CRTAC1 family protein n=1 Tax=Pseudotamlana agarivorans TaxID=481183 RepID=A0ACC5U9K4_9FLAO|nr:CRTAC1 family protein [Tamlana agarivorans]MBU2950991.1 CRTAC1 family protein [Tamlana agarivorans]